MTISDLDGPGVRSANAVRATRMSDSRLSSPLLDDTVLAAEIELETAAVRNGAKRYRDNVASAVKRGEGSRLKPVYIFLQHWFEIVSVSIADELASYRKGESAPNRACYGPVLNQLPADETAVVTMHEAVSACLAHPGGIKTVTLCHTIGRAIFAEINAGILAKTNKEAMREMRRRFRNDMSAQRVNWWTRKNTADAERDMRGQVHTGAFLLGLLIDLAACGDCADFSGSRQPAFRSEAPMRGGKTVAITKLTPEAWRIIEEGHSARRTMRPRYVPMIVRPYRWSADSDGGYVRIRTPFTAKPSPTQKLVLENSNLEPMYDALHAVTGTPHRVNRRVLKWQKAVFESGGSMLGLPPRDDKPEPPHPSGYRWELKGKNGCWEGVPIEEKRAYKWSAFQTLTANHIARGERRTLALKHEVADLMSEHGKFYYPHQLDFRGRCYPVPPHLNHQTDDVSRGLLEWGEYVEPGEAGRRELLIESANCYGYDKLSYADRVQWANDHEAKIAAAAEEPLDNDWWHPVFDAQGRQTGGAEKPWQFLAACIALNDREAAGHATVWRDGTCNGLQHYSALARDPVGGAAVNLLPCDAPADVYAQVANRVLPIIGAERELSNQIVRFKQRAKVGDAWITTEKETTVAKLAELLYDHISRKTIKPNVMTHVYGVTFVGASNQILEKLKARGVHGDLLYTASRHLARTTLGAIGEVCAGAKQIMDWLRACAVEIVKLDRPVRWTTPVLGFPVVQPYRLRRMVTIETALHALEKVVEDDSLPVNKRKQVAGFAPNFIHSIDQTHMFMAARRCRDEGLTFAGRHDAFGTHAAYQARTARITRETFVELHSLPILATLAAELRERNAEAEIPGPPPPGKLDLSKVMDAQYFFG